jgi:methyl halide transferase
MNRNRLQFDPRALAIARPFLQPMDANHPHFWESNYRSGQLPWDLDGPAPVFQRLAESGRFPIGRMIIPGAGTGHDARLFARHGFQVTAVDFAPGAIKMMQVRQDPAAPIIILQADLFDLPPYLTGRFDYVLDHTCFCAIDPARRSEYAAVARRLLRPGGTFLVLAWPIGTRSGGPPFTIRPEEMIALFEAQRFTLQEREIPVDSVPERRSQEELIVMQRDCSIRYDPPATSHSIKSASSLERRVPVSGS